MGVEVGLKAAKPSSEINSNEYFLWCNRIPCLDQANSIPRKYFKSPMSFILNTYCWDDLASSIILSQSLVINKSSTYTMIITTHWLILLMKREWSSWLSMKLNFSNAFFSLTFHCLGSCFSPYKNLINLNICLDPHGY